MTMTGSPKQISWAESIRDREIKHYQSLDIGLIADELQAVYESASGDDRAALAEAGKRVTRDRLKDIYRSCVREHLLAKTDAGEWIDWDQEGAGLAVGADDLAREVSRRLIEEVR